MIALNTKVEEKARQEAELADLDDVEKVYRGYTQKELQEACQKDIANALNIPINDVIIDSIEPGSVIIKYFVFTSICINSSMTIHISI